MAGCYRCVFEVGGWSLNLCVCVCKGRHMVRCWHITTLSSLSLKPCNNTAVLICNLLTINSHLLGLSPLSFNQTLPQSLLAISHSSPDWYCYYEWHVIGIHFDERPTFVWPSSLCGSAEVIQKAGHLNLKNEIRSSFFQSVFFWK